ncbi:Ubiquitin carboxyl-terminal hydrolase MINDY-1 [Cladochytrium tenue]|nr:Ubiquitin carboxyl-terminal hydrolase MINDY-1 [Cladochytrium tenue]
MEPDAQPPAPPSEEGPAPKPVVSSDSSTTAQAQYIAEPPAAHNVTLLSSASGISNGDDAALSGVSTEAADAAPKARTDEAEALTNEQHPAIVIAVESVPVVEEVGGRLDRGNLDEGERVGGSADVQEGNGLGAQDDVTRPSVDLHEQIVTSSLGVPVLTPSTDVLDEGPVLAAEAGSVRDAEQVTVTGDHKDFAETGASKSTAVGEPVAKDVVDREIASVEHKEGHVAEPRVGGEPKPVSEKTQAPDEERLQAPPEPALSAAPSTKAMPAEVPPPKSEPTEVPPQEVPPVTLQPSSTPQLTGGSPRPLLPPPQVVPAPVSPPRREPAKQYRLKRVEWAPPGQAPKEVQIITQNENGPCPLLALCNVLLLRGSISLPLDWGVVEYSHLVDLLGDYLLARASPGISTGASGGEHVANQLQNLQDVMELFPALQTGLDVNVHFDSPWSFEVTPSLLVFDLLGIALCHGWTVDPQDEETYAIVAQTLRSYNKVVERAIAADVDAAVAAGPNAESVLHEGLVCQAFLTSTASQLTYHGLQTIAESLPAHGVCVLFRNNHFSTLFAHPAHGLLMLVTDQELAAASPLAVWETLAGVDGDSAFLDARFRTAPAVAAHRPDAGPDAVVRLDEFDPEEQARAWALATTAGNGAVETGANSFGAPSYEDELISR